MAIKFPLGPVYPITLTNTTWQKKKSFLDKTKKNTKTGLGAQLVTLQAAWGDIEWLSMNAKAHGKWRSVEEIHAARKKAKDYYGDHLTKLYNVLHATSTKAHTTAQIAGLSNAAKVYANFISTETDKLAKLTMAVTFEDYEEAEANLRAGWARWRERLPGNVKDLESKLEQLEDDPRNANWDKLDMSFTFRSIGNVLGNDPEFKDLWPKPWEDFDGLQNTRHPALKSLKNKSDTPTPAEREAILSLVNDVRPHLKKLKKRL